MSDVTKKYGWTVGDYATLTQDVWDEIAKVVPKGTVIRIESIVVKTMYARGNNEHLYFFNACRIGDKYPRIRNEFNLLRRPTKAELLKTFTEFERRYLDNKLVA